MATKKETMKMLKEKEIRAMEGKSQKFYQYKENINGNEYVFQYPGKRACLRMTDEATTDNNKRLNEKMIDLMLKNIVVSPKVDLDYFDEYPEDYERVVDIVTTIFQGDFTELRKSQN